MPLKIVLILLPTKALACTTILWETDSLNISSSSRALPCLGSSAPALSKTLVTCVPRTMNCMECGRRVAKNAIPSQDWKWMTKSASHRLFEEESSTVQKLDV